MARLLLPFLYALTHAAAFPCTFTTPQGTFNLSSLGTLRLVEKATGWSYQASACGDLAPRSYTNGFPDDRCASVSPTPAFQITTSQCLRLGTLRERAAAPLSGKLGIAMNLGAGDSGRSAVLEVVCFDGPTALDAVVGAMVAGQPQYIFRARARAGCPLACPRDPATGSVCGGAPRGACVAVADGSAACTCVAGHEGLHCTPARSGSDSKAAFGIAAAGSRSAAVASLCVVVAVALFFSLRSPEVLPGGRAAHFCKPPLRLLPLFLAGILGALLAVAFGGSGVSCSGSLAAVLVSVPLAPPSTQLATVHAAASVREAMGLPVWEEIRATVREFTMLLDARITTNFIVVAYAAVAHLPGDIVEAGVAAGGSAASLLLATEAMRVPRTLHLFDTFAGLPPADAALDSPAALEWTGKVRHGVADVSENLDKCGVPLSCVTFHAGDIVATPLEELPQAIAVLRLDTDWYASHVWEFEHLYPRVVPGGVVILDDYADWPGAKKAVDEFLALPQHANVAFVEDQQPPVLCKPLANGERAPCGNVAFLSL